MLCSYVLGSSWHGWYCREGKYLPDIGKLVFLIGFWSSRSRRENIKGELGWGRMGLLM
jgi:hypothetical protein